MKKLPVTSKSGSKNFRRCKNAVTELGHFGDECAVSIFSSDLGRNTVRLALGEKPNPRVGGGRRKENRHPFEVFPGDRSRPPARSTEPREGSIEQTPTSQFEPVDFTGRSVGENQIEGTRGEFPEETRETLFDDVQRVGGAKRSKEKSGDRFGNTVEETDAYPPRLRGLLRERLFQLFEKTKELVSVTTNRFASRGKNETTPDPFEEELTEGGFEGADLGADRLGGQTARFRCALNRAGLGNKPEGVKLFEADHFRFRQIVILRYSYCIGERAVL
ncbi:MAG: hypothetical protein N2557_01450 [Hydrogenophilus sp.]|nr:hypothetical protein [Hydrogenophilus sp.]